MSGKVVDPRTPGQRASDRKTIRRQVRLVRERRRNRELLERATQRLQRERDRRSGAAEIDVLRTGGDAVLAVRDEFLLAAEDLPAYLRAPLPGFVHTPVGELDDRVYRVHRSAPATSRDGRRTPTGGRPLRPNFVTPMGIVMKALCGPENTAGDGLVRPARKHVTNATRVDVIDTGVSSSGRTDGWLRGLEDGDNVDPLYFRPPSDVLDLGAGHGTFAAGVVEQVATDATIRVHRALDRDGLGSELEVALAMVRAARNGADILNLSLGFETDDDAEPIALRAAVDIIAEQHPEVLIVAAAGNTGRSRKCWPAGFATVTSVAALTQDGSPADWSTRGDWVTCSTIGEGVLSTYVVGTEDELVDPDGPDTFDPHNPWALWTGTSFAAPQVAGRVADIAMARGIGVREALAELLRDCEDEPGYGRKVTILTPT